MLWDNTSRCSRISYLQKGLKVTKEMDCRKGGAKHVKTGNPLFGWTATDRSLEIPPDNVNPAPSTGTSIKNFVRGVGVGLTHTEI